MSGVVLLYNPWGDSRKEGVMKKILIIIIVILTAFSLSAKKEEGGTETTLTLTASQSGKLYHGFTNADNSSAEAIRADLSGAGSGSISISGLDLESNDPQEVGFYNLYTTGGDQATITFSVSPLHMEIDDTDYYVPYVLSFETSEGNQAAVDGDIGTDAPAFVSTSAPSAVTGSVLTTSGTGLRWLTLALTATVDGTGNVSFGLPQTTEDNYYVGTVVAGVAAP